MRSTHSPYAVSSRHLILDLCAAESAQQSVVVNAHVQIVMARPAGHAASCCSCERKCSTILPHLLLLQVYFEKLLCVRGIWKKQYTGCQPLLEARELLI